MAAERDGYDDEPGGRRGTNAGRAGLRRPASRRPLRLTRTVALALAAVVLTVSACTDDDDDPASATTTTLQPSPSTTAPPTTPPEDLTEEEEVEAAYLAIMDRYYERLEAPNPDDQSIEDGHVGESLRQVIDRNRQRQSQGQRDIPGPNGRPQPEIESITVNEAEAIILNCLIEDIQVVSAESGEIVDDGVLSFEVRSVLRFSDGVWKLADQVATGQWSDGRGCDR